MVLSGEVDVGVANALIVEKYAASPEGKDLKIVWRSPIFADYVWAVQHNLSPSITKKVLDVSLFLSPQENKTILELLRAEYFVTATLEDFSTLQKALESQKPNVQ